VFKSGAKLRFVVICLGAMALAIALIAYHHRARAVPFARSDSETENTQTNPGYAMPREVARLKNRAVKESSGLAASRINQGVFWTHNDSGDGPYLYAFDKSGAARGVWRVTNASARDWEAIALGPGPDSSKTYLYIGDIGDNGFRRSDIDIYRVIEPNVTPADARTDKKRAAPTQPAEIIQLRYPDGSHNAEALLVHPKSGDLYIVTKEVFGNPQVFQAKAPLNGSQPVTMKAAGVLKIPGLFGGAITDGSISPDGARVIICDYNRGYELVLASAAAAFDSIWKQPLSAVSLGSRKQGEAVTYSPDGKALLATSEGTPMPLIEVARK
jgi:hypothetical protein